MHDVFGQIQLGLERGRHTWLRFLLHRQGREELRGRRRDLREPGAGDRVHALLEGARALDQQVERTLGQPAAAPVGRTEDAFHLVRELDDRFGADHRGEPLDRVERPEQLPDGARLRPAMSERVRDGDEVAVDRVQPLVGFEQEPGDELLQVDVVWHRGLVAARPRTAATSAWISSGVNGLVT